MPKEFFLLVLRISQTLAGNVISLKSNLPRYNLSTFLILLGLLSVELSI